MLLRPQLEVEVELMQGGEAKPEERNQLEAMLEVFPRARDGCKRGSDSSRVCCCTLRQDTLLRVLGVLQGFAHSGGATRTPYGYQTRAGA